MFEAKKIEARARWESVSIDEIGQFIGPKAPSFLGVANGMRNNALYGKKMPRSWCWPAFFFTFAWFAYRKMYAVSAMFFILPILMAIAAGFLGINVPSSSGIILGMVCGHLAKLIYIQHAQSAILGLRKKGTLTEAKLIEAGGVSLTAGILVGLIWLLVTMLTLVPLIALFYDLPSETAIA